MRNSLTQDQIAFIHQALIEAGFPINESELKATAFGPSSELALKDFQNCHVDQDHHPLVSDGLVGPKTLWAL